MYCKANFKSVAKCKKRLCTAVFALFKKNTRRVAWPVLQSRCKALSALSQNTLKNTKTGRKSVGFLILTQAPKCTRSHCFPPQKHPKNGFVMRFAGKNSFFQLRARDFSFYMNAYSRVDHEMPDIVGLFLTVVNNHDVSDHLVPGVNAEGIHWSRYT